MNLISPLFLWGKKFISPCYPILALLQERNSTAVEEEVADITQWEAIGWLSILTLWVSVLSGYLVETLQARSTSLLIAMI